MNKNLDNLNPYVKYLAKKLIKECKSKGIDILIYETYRSIQKQNELYSKGRTSKGKKVTNAKGGYSYHNYGLAFDCVPIINNKAAWDRIDLYEKIGKVGKSIGLEWGGDFKSIKDRPHFQVSKGLKITDLLNGKTPEFGDLEFIDCINKLDDKNIINTPSYWIENNSYKTGYVRELIKKVVRNTNE